MTAKDLLQRPCMFITPEGQERHGMIVEAVEALPYGPGAIPDFKVTVRGQSGRTMSVSLVESYLRTTDK
jgi:hypothetical protein